MLFITHSVYIPVTRSFGTLLFRTLLVTVSRASFPKTQDAVFPHSRPAWAARIKCANKKNDELQPSQSKAWANTKSPMWRRKWRIQHWSCRHCDDYIWEICCIYFVCHVVANYRRMPLLQSKHINSLTARTDSYTYQKARPSRSQIPTHYLTYARRKSKLHA